MSDGRDAVHRNPCGWKLSNDMMDAAASRQFSAADGRKPACVVPATGTARRLDGPTAESRYLPAKFCPEDRRCIPTTMKPRFYAGRLQGNIQAGSLIADSMPANAGTDRIDRKTLQRERNFLQQAQ